MKFDKKSIIKIIIADLLLICFLATFLAIPWGLKNYPLHKQWNVFFVLASNTSGHDSGTGKSIFLGFVLPTILIFLIFKALFFVLIRNNFKINLNRFLSVSGGLFLLTIINLIFQTKAWRYISIAKEVSKKAESSQFYKNNLITDENFSITGPEKKQNLIILFIESMEGSYADIEDGGIFKNNLIPNLSELCKTNINFSSDEKIGSGLNLEGTSWTVAGLLSKLCAVPYFMPYTQTENGLNCLSNLKNLNDVLAEQGYNQIFSMGSEKQFEDRDSLLENHSVTIHDIVWYKKHDFIPADYQVFWGFEDAKLYSLARQELETLSKKDEPFFYGLLTVDTHFPNGFKCEFCKNDEKSQIQNVIRCADYQAGEFIKWIQSQKWYKNTTIVVLGDHAYLDAPLNNFLYKQSSVSKEIVNSKRGFFNLIINPVVEIPVEKQKNRKFSSFDITPTVLESIGNKIEGKGMYLGRSLISDEKTLCEKLDIKSLESEIMKKASEYEALK